MSDQTTPTPARPAPADADLRDRIAAALAAHHIDPDTIDAAGHLYCSCSEWGGVMGCTEQDHLAEVAVDALTPVLAARDARIAELEGLLRDAEDYLSVTHTYPAAGTGGHDTLGADFSCSGCALAKKLKEADRA